MQSGTSEAAIVVRQPIGPPSDIAALQLLNKLAATVG